MFEDRAHAIQVVFEVDHDRTTDQLQAIQQPSEETAKRLGMDLSDLFAARIDVMKQWTAAERCFIVLRTNPEALSKTEVKEEKKQAAGKLSGKISSFVGQNPLAAVALIRNRHSSFVDAVRSELAAVDIMSDVLPARAALRTLRETVDPSFTAADWNPSLPGDRIYPAQRQEKAGFENWDVLWPKLGTQVVPRDANVVGANVVEIGDRIYSPVYLELFPRRPEFFSELFARTMEKRLPWRISFLMEGAGLTPFGFKAAVAGIIGFASSGNDMISNAYKDLTAFQNEAGETIVQARVAACTWAPKEKPDLLAKRVSDLTRSLQSWGTCEVSSVTGDPMAGLASTLPMFSQGSVGTKTAAFMDEFLGMMPWMRPSSPWKEGAVTFRSPDGKLMPYQPYSSIQTTWINLVFARPGSGKSVLMNLCNLALVLAPGQTRLPRIAIIDIGPSSGGLISLVKESLPSQQRHLVVHRRLRMVEKDAINSFDTQLGCRFPSPSELTFLRNLVTLLVTDFNSEMPDKGMPNLVAAVIDGMYKNRSDRADPVRFSPGMNSIVDEAIKRTNIHLDTRSTWWEVVDALFSAGETYAAAVAQRNAVPLLSEAVGVAQSEKIRVTFGGMRVADTDELLIDAFCRMIGDALGMYPIMSRPTAFDVGEARIVALDLDEVAKSGGVVADRQTAVMYMLARQVLAKDFFLSPEIVSDMPAPPHVELRDTVPAQAYRDYHLQRIKDLREDPKRICFDEFHRTSKAQMVREQVLVDMREGRKWKVDIMLASQDLEDFDDLMIKMSTGIFVMDGGNASTIDDISRRFGFSDPAERFALERRVHGPRRGGGTFLAKFSTVQGWYTMLLSATLGPLELWAFSTTAEDAAIRGRLYERIGQRRARKVLAYAYPGGSARDDIEDRKARMRESDQMVLDGKADNVIDQIVNDLIDLERRLT
jgi:intracellular multiplication protein IcmB